MGSRALSADCRLRSLKPAYITFCVAVMLRCVRIFLVPLRADERVARLGSLPDGVPASWRSSSLVVGERVSWRLVAPGALAAGDHRCGDGGVLGAGQRRTVSEICDRTRSSQFLPVLLMPLLLLLFPRNRRSAMWLWWTFAGYVVAKLAEQLDGPIYDAIGLSGHSIKHFASSVAVLFAVFAMLEMKAPRDVAR